jgi:MFS family permease
MASLLRRRDFALLWSGETVSETGSMVTAVALPLVALGTLHAGPFAVGVIAASAHVAWLLIGLPAGVWADRVRRRPLLVAADLGRAVLAVTVPLAWAAGVLTVAQLVVVALLTGLLTVLFTVAYPAYLPAVVPAERLVEANGALQASSAGAVVAGSGLGGLLVQVLGAPVALLADAVSYLVSAACLLGIRSREPAPARPVRTTLRADVAEGLRYVLGHPLHRSLAISCSLANLVLSGYDSMLVVFLVREVGLSAQLVGLLLGAGGLGGLAGGLLTGRLARRYGDARLLWTTPVMTTIGGLLVLLTTRGAGLAWYIAGSLLLHGAVTIFTVCAITAVQIASPPALLARTTASIRLFSRGGLPLGPLAGGALVTAFGPRTGLALLVAWLVVVPVVLRRSPLGRVRRVADLVVAGPRTGAPVHPATQG